RITMNKKNGVDDNSFMICTIFFIIDIINNVTYTINGLNLHYLNRLKDLNNIKNTI
ncbi:MAG: hypothetical protein RLZZ628_1187, partial [Bacteroidota bacterium]